MKCIKCRFEHGVVDGLCGQCQAKSQIDPKMTIAVFLAESPWGEIDDSAMDKGLGGRETALVYLATEWALAGHDVYAFVPRSTTEIIEAEMSGGKVRWIPNQYTIEITEAVQPDLFVSWENVEVLKALENYHGIRAIEMQVAHLNTDVPVESVTDYVCVLSEWAGEFFRTCHDIDKARVPVFPNGVAMRRFEDLSQPASQRPGTEDTYNFIYSSSPDRGLHHLLRMWPQIQDMMGSEFGNYAQLHVCYGVENFVTHSRWSHREDGIRALDIESLLTQHGITYHGKIGQDKLAALMAECDLMLYPADTMSPTETGCISIVEALAAGTPVVTTDCDCIGPEFEHVTTQTKLPLLGYDNYIASILDTLDPEDYMARVEAGMEFAHTRDWSLIAQQWIDFFLPLTKNN